MLSCGTFKPNGPKLATSISNTEASIKIANAYVGGNITTTSGDGYARCCAQSHHATQLALNVAIQSGAFSNPYLIDHLA
jgi:hypothetical protein